MKIKPGNKGGLNTPPKRPPKPGTQESEETPLPCPFCGGEAYIRNKEQINSWGIGCMSFGCHGEYTIKLSNYDSRDLAVKIWNMRK